MSLLIQYNCIDIFTYFYALIKDSGYGILDYNLGNIISRQGENIDTRAIFPLVSCYTEALLLIPPAITFCKTAKRLSHKQCNKNEISDREGLQSGARKQLGFAFKDIAEHLPGAFIIYRVLS